MLSQLSCITKVSPEYLKYIQYKDWLIQAWLIEVRDMVDRSRVVPSAKEKGEKKE